LNLKKITLFSFFSLFLVSAQAADLEFMNRPYKHELFASLIAGQTFTLKYDPQRLGNCTSMNRMYQSFTVAYYRFDNGPIENTESFNAVRESTVTISVPKDVQSLEIWFKNYTLASPTAAAVCESYDSDFGRNYHFEIQN